MNAWWIVGGGLAMGVLIVLVAEFGDPPRYGKIRIAWYEWRAERLMSRAVEAVVSNRQARMNALLDASEAHWRKGYELRKEMQK